MFKIPIKSSKRNEIIDITSEVIDFVKSSKIESGLCVVFCPHTTGGIFINENYDGDVKLDIIRKFDELIKNEDYFKHSEGNSDSHIKTMLVGSSETIIIDNDKLMLGTWQGIFFYEFDGPRSRNVFIKVIKDK
ncbi:secondary thiamine-phosphate synthase enzyme YjbQ [Candidatus Woesearchaeota archaeon]|nr:secondary thiamine-phosphate synthase enzyme YjbQ [Candidatus Woesearchaeota archaeon]